MGLNEILRDQKINRPSVATISSKTYSVKELAALVKEDMKKNYEMDIPDFTFNDVTYNTETREGQLSEVTFEFRSKPKEI